jgi:hypothetical protein
MITPPALPLIQMEFVSEGTILAGGYDRKPCRLSITKGGQWTWDGFLTASLGGSVKVVKSAVQQRMAAFNKSQAATKTVEEPWIHPTPITCIRRM